jgi:TonB-linked SusC/RagA family outer membrane protein
LLKTKHYKFMKKKQFKIVSGFIEIWKSKLLLTMKLTVIALCLTVFQGFALITHGQSAKVNLKMENISIKQVLRLIENQTNFFFIYNGKFVNVERKVDVNIENQSINDALIEIFTGTDIKYEIDNRQILLSSLDGDSRSSIQQQKSVSGKVTETSGSPLPGVTIVVKGTTNGTITDENGTYSLTNTPTNATLQFSFVGMKMQEILVGNKTTINIVLEEEAIGLDEVVAVGYGSMKKSDITGSVASISKESLKEISSANITQSLQGRVSGVQIKTTSTRPGGEGQIRIRGTRSLTASNDPLIVVDGIPFNGSLNDINSSIIKSVDILKDVSATAIYGSRGANGVILITTESIDTGIPHITFESYEGVNTVARKYSLYNGPEFLKMAELAGFTGYTPVELEAIDKKMYTDWQDLMYKPGRVIDNQLNISGGTKTGNYLFGIGYYDNTSIMPGMEFQRYSSHAAINQNFGNRIKMGFSSDISYGITDGATANVMYTMLALRPVDQPYTSTGAIRTIPNGVSFFHNPLLMKNKESWADRKKRISTFNSLFGELQITKDLKYRINIGANYSQDQYGNYYASATVFKSGGQSTAEVNNDALLDLTIENLIYYNRTYKEKHKINFTGLYSMQRTEFNNTDILATDMIANNVQYYNLALSNSPTNVLPGKQIYSKRVILSYMGRINYSYDDRYLFTLTGRADGSSVLAPGKKWHYYPAVAIAWSAINESFLKNQKLLSNLKVRLSFGQTSNQAVTPYTTLGGISQNKYNFGPNNVYGFYLSTLPNEDLDWEYTKSTNIGIDFGFLKNRIFGKIELYNQHTSNVLLSQGLPPTSGVSGYFLTNVGETSNKGIELDLSSVNIGRKFNWSSDFSFSLNRNKILSLNSGVTRDEGNGWFVGQPIDVIFDYEKIGIWQLNEAAEAANYGSEPGEIKIRDSNNNGKIDAGDRNILGNLEPNFEVGLTNRFAYKGFDLSIVAFARVGGKLISVIHQPASSLNMLGGAGARNGIKVDYWTTSNPTNEYPKPNGDRGDNPVYGSTLGYFDATFLNIRNINLGYTIPKIGQVKSLYVYTSCENVATLFSPYLRAGGVSPQTTGYGGGQEVPGRQLTIVANVPPTRSFIIGFKLNF